MRLIIAGGRHFMDYNLMKTKLDIILSSVDEDIQIVSGMANGADTLGLRYASENKLFVKEFYAEWGKHGKKAGPIRNKEMAEYSTHCICFWDGVSRGTENMISLSKEYGLNLRVINY